MILTVFKLWERRHPDTALRTLVVPWGHNLLNRVVRLDDLGREGLWDVEDRRRNLAVCGSSMVSIGVAMRAGCWIVPASRCRVRVLR